MLRSGVLLAVLLVGVVHPVRGSQYAEDLFTVLMKDYQKFVRPSYNSSHPVTVFMHLQLIQLIGVNEVSQVIMTNVVVKQIWQDYRLTWNPNNYGGIKSMSIPSTDVWTPDIVLYNNAEGDYQIKQITTKVSVNYTGGVKWDPPAVYKSYCQINVRYFPYDKQECELMFSSWTYDATLVNVMPSRGYKADQETIEVGMDLSKYHKSVEWDILEASSRRDRQIWPYGPWAIIYYKLVIRRKALFYTINLVIPCVLISFLTIFVFYLPADSGEKVTLCISILLSLTVFILLLAAIIPPTSENVPLLGRYLLFTLIMTCLSIALTIIVINVHLRNPATHQMRPCIRKVLLHWLPKVLRIERPVLAENESPGRDASSKPPKTDEKAHNSSLRLKDAQQLRGQLKQEKFRDVAEVQTALNGVDFIMAHTKQTSQYATTVRDWKYAAFVLDRLFLLMFAVAVVVGSGAILLDAPPLWEGAPTIPIDCPDPNTADFWVCIFKVEGED